MSVDTTNVVDNNTTDADDVDTDATADSQTDTTETNDSSIESLVKIAIEDLTITKYVDSQIGNLERASAAHKEIVAAARDWFEGRKRQTGATRRAALGYVRLRRECLDNDGNPVWSGQRAVSAWRVLHTDRVKPMFEAMLAELDMTGDTDAIKAFDDAVRKYVSDRFLIRVAAMEYAVHTTNGLGDTKFSSQAGAPDLTTKRAVEILAGPNAEDAIALEGFKWNAKLAKAVHPHIVRQRSKGSKNNPSKAYRGFETEWTSVAPRDGDKIIGGTGSSGSSNNNNGGTGGDPNVNPTARGNVGQETYKGAVDKLKTWSKSQHWNPEMATEMLHDVLTEWSKDKLNTGRKVKDLPKVAENLTQIGDLAAIQGSALLARGNKDRPNKDDVEANYFVDES